MDTKERIRLKRIKNKFETDINSLKKHDEKKRKHGSNPIIRRLISYVDELEQAIKGEDCQFYSEDNWCNVLEDTCDVMDKSSCMVRIEQLKKINQKKKNKKTLYVKIRKYKVVKNEE